MKKLLLFSATLMLAVLFIGCKGKKTDPSINADYVDDMKEVLCLEETPMIEEQPVNPMEDIDRSVYMVYTGTIGDKGATLCWAPWNNRTEEDKANGICGYLAMDENPRLRYTLREVSDEPHIEGYNTVVIDIIQGEEKKAVLEGTIEGRGDGFYGTVTFEGTGEKKEFSLMQQY